MTKLYIDAEANDHPVNEHPRLSGHKQAVISLSGGMDSSTVLLRLLAEGYQVTAISFDYGQKHNVELLRAAELVEYLNYILQIPEEETFNILRTYNDYAQKAQME